MALRDRLPLPRRRELLDWNTPERWAGLEAGDNVFARVVMPQIQAKASGDAQTLRAWKLRPIRLMYDRGYARKTILELSRIIDWMIRLPAAVEAGFLLDVYNFEETKRMPYVASAERSGI